jgi:outer membrane biosynthesis protein TonB
MTLALILGLSTLLVSPPGTSRMAGASLIFQANPLEQSADQSSEQKTQSTPSQTLPATSAPATREKPAVTDAPKPETHTAKTPAKKRRPRPKKVPVEQPADAPKKVIVNNGGAPDPTLQLSPGVNPEAASRQRQSTNLLLSTAESNLKATEGRQLNPSQQDMVTQVREYLKQAKASADGGDLQRAHNLAFKAKLLSDELAKH